MSPDHEHRLEEVFDHARVLPPQERAAFLAAACAGDAALRAEVESLLSAHEQAGQFLQPTGVLAARNNPFEQASRCLQSAAAPFSPPKTRLRYFGDYELLEEIARGGMGVVYKARQISLDRIVAVKMILAGNLASELVVKRFLQEARAAANLQHPNIVAIHEVGLHENQHYFSMDYVEGKNFSQIAQEGPLPAARAARYLKQMAEAVHFAHQRGTLHRDLKPHNVLLDALDQPRITDFGLAKQLAHDATLTQSGAVMGSPSYMAPEQAAGRNDQVGPPSDVYSLGAILYQLLTGRAPFVGDSALEIMRQVRDEDPVAPCQLNRKIPADLETICLRCLEKKPPLRYDSAQALAEDLERFLNHEPILARRRSPARRIWSWTVRHPWALTGAGSVVLLVFMGLLFGSWEQIKQLRWQLAHPGKQPLFRVEDFFSQTFQFFLSLEFFILQILPLVFFIRDRAQELLTRKNLSRYAILGVIQVGFGLYLILRLNAAIVWTDPLPWKWLAGGIVLVALTNIWFGFRLLWHTGHEYRSFQDGPAAAPDQQMVLIRLVKRYPLFLVLAAEAIFLAFYAQSWNRFFLSLGIVLGMNLVVLLARMLLLARGEEKIIYLPPILLSSVMVILGLKALEPSRQILEIFCLAALGSILIVFLVRLERTLAPRVSPLAAKFNRMIGPYIRAISYGFRVLVALLVAVYLVEDWRGNRAWDKAKAELIAKGAHLDWEYYRPKPLPDDQNIMKAPIMEAWFVKTNSRANSPNKSRYHQLLDAELASPEIPVFGVKLVLIPPDSTLNVPANAPVFDLAALKAGEQRFASLYQLLPAGRHLVTAKNLSLIERVPVPGKKPPTIYLRVPANQVISEIKALFQQNGIAESQMWTDSTDGPNVFIISAWGRTAADLIRNTAPFQPDFELIREALTRPGSYLQPFGEVTLEKPLGFFIGARAFAQSADLRIRANLLLNRPEDAWRELRLMNDLRRCLGSNSPDLLSAMISTAIFGLFMDDVKQGYTMRTWTEKQYAEIQGELENIDLISVFRNSLEVERAAALQFLDLPRDIAVRLSARMVMFPVSLTNSPYTMFHYVAPQGWISQNMKLIAQQHQRMIDILDSKEAIVSPPIFVKHSTGIERAFARAMPYTYIARYFMQGYDRCAETVARNQTQVNLGICAFALERYRLKHGSYPNKLEDLTPEFMRKLPHDLVNGTPLKYQRETPDRFILYSIGWDLKDDHGKPSVFRGPGDWIWKSAL